MARIRPFKGIRPAHGLEESVATLPYDVISEEEARNAVKENSNSFFHIIRPEVNLPLGTDIHSEPVYHAAGEAFQDFINRGTLIRDGEPSLYLYTMEMDGRVQTGLVVSIHTGDYRDGIIKRHELTREDKEQDRVNHLDAVNANTGPVYLLFNNHEKVSFASHADQAEELCNFTAHTGVRHQVHRITDAAILEKLVDFFQDRELYIADGHHRAASAARVAEMRNDEDSRYFLAVVFPHNELQILPYNRAVADLRGMSCEEFLQKAGETFSIEKGQAVPRERGTVSCYCGGTWYEMKPLGAVPEDPVASLDVSLLQERLLDPVLGISNPRTDSRIQFVGGIKGTGELERLVDNGHAQVAFSLYPTGIDQLIDVSDAGGLMPPKSTWFEPKLMSGLVVHPLFD